MPIIFQSGQLFALNCINLMQCKRLCYPNVLTIHEPEHNQKDKVFNSPCEIAIELPLSVPKLYGKSAKMFNSRLTLLFEIHFSGIMKPTIQAVSVKIALIRMHCTVRNCTGCAMFCVTQPMNRDLEPRLSNYNTVLTAATTVADVVQLQLPSNHFDTIPPANAPLPLDATRCDPYFLAPPFLSYSPSVPSAPPILTSLPLLWSNILSP